MIFIPFSPCCFQVWFIVSRARSVCKSNRQKSTRFSVLPKALTQNIVIFHRLHRLPSLVNFSCKTVGVAALFRAPCRPGVCFPGFIPATGDRFAGRKRRRNGVGAFCKSGGRRAPRAPSGDLRPSAPTRCPSCPPVTSWRTFRSPSSTAPRPLAPSRHLSPTFPPPSRPPVPPTAPRGKRPDRRRIGSPPVCLCLRRRRCPRSLPGGFPACPPLAFPLAFPPCPPACFPGDPAPAPRAPAFFSGRFLRFSHLILRPRAW